MSNKSKEETDCYINFNTADGQILKYTLEGYVENVYVSTRDARDALIDMYDICIETNPYSDAAKQILILAAFINIYNKSRMKPAHIVRWISRWPEGEKAMRDYIEEADRSSSEWNRGSVSA